MKQIFIKKGKAVVEEVPVPKPSQNEIIVQASFSCISPGTERKQVEDSRSEQLTNKIGDPKRIKKAFDMIRSEGISSTLAKVKGDLELGALSGYSLSGIVIETGEDVNNFSIGERVACVGAENAFHAEYVRIPSLLAVALPEQVEMEEASSVALGAISIQGIRRSNIQIGEYVAIIGLGALGLITGLILIRAGYHIIGFDLKPERLEFAKSLGFHEVLDSRDDVTLQRVGYITKGYGVDAAIITAASSDASPIELGSKICRKKGRVVMVGNTSLNLNRKMWYQKELDLLLSTSYGPGRYDQRYEVEGQDYPYAYVRWTENRNMVSYIEQLRMGLSIRPLIGKVYPFSEATIAFDSLTKDTSVAPLSLIQYLPTNEIEHHVQIKTAHRIIRDRIKVAIIGPGNFARDIHLPNLLKLKDFYQIYSIMSRQGHRAKEVALRYGAKYATTDYNSILDDDQVDLVFISTRHDLHASLAIKAALAGKAIFVEKPMATTIEQLMDLKEILYKSKVPFMVGFNRRFSPLSIQIKKLLQNRRGPMIIFYRINTNPLPVEHWVHGSEGGGRVIGEGCHFVDLVNFFISSEVHSFSTETIRPEKDQRPVGDNFQVTIKYKDGSLANILYTSIGSTTFSKEYIEIFFDGQVITLDNFQKIEIYNSHFKMLKTKRQDKGHLQELEQMAYFLKGEKESLIDLSELIETTLMTFNINDRLRGREV